MPSPFPPILVPGCTFTTTARTRDQSSGLREMAMFRWIIKEQLASGPRPRTKKKPTSQVQQHTVDAWLRKAKTLFGIRSIICLLDQRQLRLYESLRVDLVSYHRVSGFRVVHIPVRNYKHPALSNQQLENVWNAGERSILLRNSQSRVLR